MPLVDITKKPYKVNPNKESKNPIVLKIKTTLPKQSLKFLDRVYEEAIESSIRDGDNLTWTKSGALFGHTSKRPKHDIDRLWDNVVKCVGDGKECLMAVGAILRVKIAERPEDWYVIKQETGEVDPLTGKDIYVSEYWIKS